MDEPLKSLDPGLKLRIISDLNKLIERENKTVLFVTHDVKEALLIADTIIVFSPIPARVVEQIDIVEAKRERKFGSLSQRTLKRNL